MKNKVIKKNNKLIAEFMGFKPSNENSDSYTRWYHPEGFGPVAALVSYFPEEFIFNTSWDFLMPVVEKIELTKVESLKYDGFFFTITTNETKINSVRIMTSNFDEIVKKTNGDCDKLRFTYEAVVDFIKWYNKNK